MTVLVKKHRHRKGSTYAFILLSYISILLLSLSSSILYYAQIRRQITAQTEISRQLLLTQLQGTVEAGTLRIEDLCNEMAFDKSIYQYAKELPAISSKEVKSVLSAKMYRDDVLFDYFIYIKATDEIITPTITMSAQKFYDIIYTFSNLSYEEFREQYLDAVYFQQYMPIQDIEVYDDNKVQILPLVHTFPVNYSQEPLGQIICFLDADKLFGNVNLIQQSTGSDVYVLNESNEIIINSVDASLTDMKWIDTIASGNRNKDTVISKRVADSTGWKFIIQTPNNLSLAENQRYLTTALGIFLIYLAAGLFLVRFQANKSYHPIFEINTLIQDNASGGPAGLGTVNEFENIKSTILHQFQKDKQLTGIIHNQIPYVRRAIFDRILKGLVTDYDKIYERLQELDMIFLSRQYLLVSLVVEESSPFLCYEGTFDENLYLARLIVSNVGNELFEEHFFSYYLDYEQQQCVFFLNALEELQAEETIRLAFEKVDELQRFIQEKFQIFCYIGISKQYTSLSSTPLCFDEARKASEYGRLVQAKAPVTFEDILDLENNYYYPPEIEYQLISSLKSGLFDQAKIIIDNIFQLNIKNKNLSSHALTGLLFELNTTLQKQVNRFSIAKGEAPLVKEDYQELLDSPSMETVKARFYSMIEQIADQKMRKNGSGKTEKLVSSIASYINEHAADRWIDLNILSEEFHVTPQYISNIFKRYQKENIKDYISKAKLEKAKELLRTTELSVNEIAQMLGYAGEIGIIRLFKKYEIITPGDFRMLNGQQQKPYSD